MVSRGLIPGPFIKENKQGFTVSLTETLFHGRGLRPLDEGEANGSGGNGVQG